MGEASLEGFLDKADGGVVGEQDAAVVEGAVDELPLDRGEVLRGGQVRGEGDLVHVVVGAGFDGDPQGVGDLDEHGLGVVAEADADASALGGREPVDEEAVVEGGDDQAGGHVAEDVDEGFVVVSSVGGGSGVAVEACEHAVAPLGSSCGPGLRVEEPAKGGAFFLDESDRVRVEGVAGQAGRVHGGLDRGLRS